MRAVVAEGAEVYLVRRGEVFAQRYLATSVDPAVVLAVKASRAWDAENRSYAQAERISNPASNQADKYLQFPLPGLPSLQAANQLGSGNQFLTALGLNLLRSSLTGLGVRTHHALGRPRIPVSCIDFDQGRDGCSTKEFG